MCRTITAAWIFTAWRNRKRSVRVIVGCYRCGSCSSDDILTRVFMNSLSARKRRDVLVALPNSLTTASAATVRPLAIESDARADVKARNPASLGQLKNHNSGNAQAWRPTHQPSAPGQSPQFFLAGSTIYPENSHFLNAA